MTDDYSTWRQKLYDMGHDGASAAANLHADEGLQGKAEEKRPLISLILIAFNRKEYITSAFRSVLAQNIESSLFEIIVIKNFPVEIIDSWKGKPAVMAIPAPSAIKGESYSVGVRLSRGDIICFLDDDDEFEPDKFGRLLALFSTCNGPVYYHNQRTIIDGSGRSVSGRWIRPLAGSQKEDLIILSPDKVRESTMPATFAAYFNMSSMALSRQILINMLQELAMAPPLIDIFMICTAVAANATFMFDSRRLTKYRVHSNQVSYWEDGRFSGPEADERTSVIGKHIVVQQRCMPFISGTGVERTFVKSLPRLVLTNQLYYSSKRDYLRLVRNLYSYIRMRNAGDLPDILGLFLLSFAYSISYKLPRRVAGIVKR